MAQAVACLGSHAAPVALGLINAAVARALFTGASRVGLREHDGRTASARRRWLLNGHFAKLCGGKDRSFRRRLRCGWWHVRVGGVAGMMVLGIGIVAGGIAIAIAIAIATAVGGRGGGEGAQQAHQAGGERGCPSLRQC